MAISAVRCIGIFSRHVRHLVPNIATLKRRCKTLLAVSVCSIHIPTMSNCTAVNVRSSVHDDHVENPFSWLTNCSAEFGISGNHVQIIYEPTEFFHTLLDLTNKATKRITLASLYLGTGPLESELVESLKGALTRSNGHIKTKFLFDFTRGSRGGVNSRTMLIPLLLEFPQSVQVALFHTPSLRGWIKEWLPERWNETLSLSHLKVYLFDNTIIMSGANLNEQYFTNRQDRYVVFEDCPHLADFFDDLVSVVSTFSFQLNGDNEATLHHDWPYHPFEGDPELFASKAQEKVTDLIEKYKIKCAMPDAVDSGSVDTFVYPLIQMFPFGITQDQNATNRLIRNSSTGSLLKLASGYFNLTDEYMKVILKESKAKFSILMASPRVNGFYGASGVAGAIPNAYTHIAHQFFQQVHESGEKSRIRLYEYDRDKWTFHVKGLWYYLPNELLPSLTLIGSPNFGYRSVYRDLEAQVAIATTNKELRERLHKEQQLLYGYTEVVAEDTFQRPDRSVPLWVKFVTRWIKTFF